MVLDGYLETWDEVGARTEFTGILVGNGASLAVWDGFAYESLYNVAAHQNPTNRLVDADIALFDVLHTRNFEHVLAGLAMARRVTIALGVNIAVILERYTSIQNALVEAVRRTHVPWANVPGATLEKIRSELLNYRFIYSTNYDLLVYWAIMHENQGGFKDFFWEPFFDLANTELWGKPTVALYLHGGLHLYRTINGRTVKRHAQDGLSLLELFGTPLDEEATPLFISEGSAADKMASIHRSDYLAFAYTKLAHHEGPLCVFGHSLGDMDGHIVQALKQARIRDIAISVRPGPAQAIVAAKAHAIGRLPAASLTFYDSSSHPLGSADLRIEH